MNSVLQHTDVPKVAWTRPWVRRIGVRIQHFARFTLLPGRYFWREYPLATIQLCAHESGSEEKQKDEGVAEKSEVVCQQRFVERYERGDFQRCPAAAPVDRDRCPPELRIPRAPDPVRQIYPSWTGRVYFRLFSWFGFVFHRRRLPGYLYITTADAKKRSSLHRVPAASQLVRHRARTIPSFLPRSITSRRAPNARAPGITPVLP